MKKWRNPYITLNLDPMASDAEIRSRAETLSDISEESGKICRSAREDLTQNVDKMFPAFLTAIPELASSEEAIKQLRRRNKKLPVINDAILQDAFAQMGLSFTEDEIAIGDVDTSILSRMQQMIGLKQHEATISEAEKEAGIKVAAVKKVASGNKYKIIVPQLYKG